MKTLTTIGIVALSAVFAGCSKHEMASTDWQPDARHNMNAWAVNTYFDDQSDAAVVAEHTLYPHHFVPYGPLFNELGEHHMSILAHHYVSNPGRLNVRQGGVDDGTYKARLKTVADTLRAAGVDMKRVAIADENAGGYGLHSERVVVILDTKMDEPLSTDNDSFSVGSE